jgi:hypothetical protein
MAGLPASHNSKAMIMTEQRRVVFNDSVSTDRLPDWAAGGVAAIEWLQQRGFWREIGGRLKIQREGGYAGIDAFQFPDSTGLCACPDLRSLSVDRSTDIAAGRRADGIFRTVPRPT